MQLCRFGDKGQEKPGLIDKGGVLRDLSSHIPDLCGSTLDTDVFRSLRRLDPAGLPAVTGKPRFGPCVGGVSKVIGVAINYQRHGLETGLNQPMEPVLFLKAPSSIAGAFDDIQLPPHSVKTDWEVELGVIIGRAAKNISVESAMDHVAGYCVVDDVSERAFQLERGGQQHTKGKSADSFCPLGPYFVTRDEIIDPQKLRLWTKVNGVSMQDGSTADMIFSVRALVSYISEFMTLLPGDVIATGTPDGVGRGRTPPLYLKASDVIELGIEGLGQQRHQVR